MYERSSSLVLRWLKVPPEPHPPQGDPASLRVFRAGKNYFNLRFAGWVFAQALAFAGIVFWLWVFVDIEAGVRNQRLNKVAVVKPTNAKDLEAYVKRAVENDSPAEVTAPPAATPAHAVQPAQNAASATTGASVQATATAEGATVAPAAPSDASAKPATEPARKKRAPRNRITGWGDFRRLLVSLALLAPPWAFPILWGIKIIGILLYLIQLPVTYAVRRLDWEMRWYMVTDRSLRIRNGVWNVQESTMSFANIQQVVVTQDPLQRLLGLANVRVQSAGGGGGSAEDHKHHGEDMHLGVFHAVTNASEIRDLILERLKRFRDSGLGDPEELRRAAHAPAAIPTTPVAATAVSTATPELLAAARELASEARALRVALS